MNQTNDTLLRQSGLGFFGAIAASLSHELSNVFATINELSGLLEDLALAAERGKAMDPARIGNVAGRITAQLRRGQCQTRQLNQFAHSADSPRAQLDGRQVIEEMVALCERFFRLRKVQLKGVASGEPVPMETDPFLFRQLVWACLELALAATEPGDRAQIGITATHDGARLEVMTNRSGSTASRPEDGAEAAVLSMLAQALGGRIQDVPHSGEPFRLAVLLPQRATVEG